MKSVLSSRIHPSTMMKQQFQVQVEQMKKQTFAPFKIQKCSTHLLPKQLICVNKKCKYFKQLICNDCQHCSHNLIKINKIVPVLTQWILKEYTQIENQNHKLNEQWNIVSQNIKYCIDIFQELLKIIENHLYSKIYAPKKFIQITNTLHGMFIHDLNNSSPQMFAKNWAQLQQKYSLFQQTSENHEEDKQNQFWTNIRCESLEIQKKQRLSHAQKANEKSKKFSEKALAFSQSLAELIQSKIKQQEHKVKIKEIKVKNQICLKDLVSKFGTSTEQLENTSKVTQMLQNIQTFNMQISGKQGSKVLDSEDIETQLGQIRKLKNLKELRINNKNGKINHKMWYCILNYVEMLKFLKDLKLTLTQQDLPRLLTLFQQKQNSVRQIQSLTLQITDEKQLDLGKVNAFINTLQLKKLNLNLSRNNLDFKKIYDFIKKLRVYTSLSQLPLIQCKIILTANKIHLDEKIQIEKLFKEKCKDIKISLVTL